jgi:poly-gamma-glutamate capsule biosynthesis protein CapA/YwtB (metallophosphatase superfamily)
MPPRRRPARLALAAGAVLVVAAASGVAVLKVASGAGAAAPAASRTPRDLPRVDSTLPAWLAPGTVLTVTGWTTPGTRVTLLANGRTLVVGKSGRLGRFRVQGVVPAPARYRIAVASAGRRVPAGRLLVRPAELAAVGDVTFGANVGAAIDAQGPGYPWLAVARVLRHADLASANLEGVVSTRGEPVPDKQYHFRGPPSALAAAARLGGIDLFTVANNHSLDYGADAFLDTLRYAHEDGLLTVGGGATLAEARRPALVSLGGLRLAVLGYSDVLPTGFTAGPDTAGTAPADPAEIAADVRAARKRADVVVVWFHWGVERDTQPTARQQALADAALGAGASVVLGAHPHVLQPIETRGRKLVAWSLGNFVFGANSPGTERTGILLVRLDTRGVTGYTLRPATIVGIQPRLN